MQFSSSLNALAVLLFANVAFTSPIAEPEVSSAELDRRATVDCGGSYRFTTAAQNKAYTDAIAHLGAGTAPRGNNGKTYPEYYGDEPNVVGIPTSCKENYMDLRIYPIYVQDTTTFTDGSAPGQDRVVISRHIDGTRERCGIISHRDQASGQFKWCGI